MSGRKPRVLVSDAEQALGELGRLSRPPWLEGRHCLPFSELTPDEFEILCFLLLRAEREAGSPAAPAEIFYYGKTGDRGRDIVHKTPRRHTLIQCKHYRGNVGIGAIREEMAKLVTNVHDGSIQTPDEVAFFVTTDLTSDAQDLLNDHSKWEAAAEKALREHLDADPSSALLTFAKTWRPAFSHQSGVLLTQRATALPGVALVHQFFTLQKVISGDISELAQPLKRIEDMLLLLQPQTPAWGAFQQLVRDYESLNPLLSFTISADSSTTTYNVKARPGANPVLGQVRFPPTEAGERGAQKFRIAEELGREVKLESDEFEWTSAIREPRPHPEVVRSELCIRPQVPDRRIPVRLEASNREGSDAIPMTYMTMTRAGTKEVEFSVAGGRLGGTMNFIITRENKGDRLNVTLNLGSVPARMALSTARFILRLADSGTIVVRSLELDALLFDTSISSFPFDTQGLANSVELLEQLAFVNEKLGCDLRHPDAVSRRDAHTMNLVYKALRSGGKVEDTELRLRTTLPVPQSIASKMLPGWQAGKTASLVAQNWSVWTFDGNTIPVGDTETSLVDCRLDVPLGELASQIQGAAESDDIAIPILCEHRIHRFLAFVPAETPEGTDSAHDA